MRLIFILTLVSSTFLCNSTMADALVVTQAMYASTIAEIFVEDDSLLFELEVGSNDLATFANVLPDEAFFQVTGKRQPLAERTRVFLDTDWTVLADGRPLSGSLERVMPTRRVARDEVTGDQLPIQPDEAEHVLRIWFRYRWDELPKTLTVRPPRSSDGSPTTIGFVGYHRGLPVNDFRYMPAECQLNLDWDDPWYSFFDHPNLRRQFAAPLSAYLYVEPYEVRQEIIVRPIDLEPWLNLGLRHNSTIAVASQADLKRQVAEFLATKNPVRIDGKTVAGKLDRIHFIHRSLRTTGIIDPAVDLDATSATLGVIFVYPIEKLPEKVEMTWELFTPRIQSVPSVASDEAGGLPSEITSADPVLTWTNYLTNPTAHEFQFVPIPPGRQRVELPLLSLAFAAMAAALICHGAIRWNQQKGFPRWAAVAAFMAIAVGVAVLPLGFSMENPFAFRSLQANDVSSDDVEHLLHNVYRSFDHHDDELIYDFLAMSIDGDLLEDVYLSTRKSIEVKNQGGLRVSVKDVSVTELEPLDETRSDLTFRCRWRVAGSIGHWGHIHRRENEHVANLSLGPRDGRWKITALEILDASEAAPIDGPQS